MYAKQSARCQRLARYIVDTKSTVRSTAKVFGVSKSTVHMDVTRRLNTLTRSYTLPLKLYWTKTRRSATFAAVMPREKNTSS